jgi:hypothetical protein
MRSQVAGALVGLGLDDPPDRTAGGAGVEQVHAEEVARDQERFAGIDGAGAGGGRHAAALIYEKSVGLKPDLQ